LITGEINGTAAIWQQCRGWHQSIV